MHTPFRNQLANITRYSTFKELSSLFYGDLPVTSGSSIVSSIEFDKDGDFFAVGGVTKKIKVERDMRLRCLCFYLISHYCIDI